MRYAAHVIAFLAGLSVGLIVNGQVFDLSGIATSGESLAAFELRSSPRSADMCPPGR
jgi:hypothetical protein